MICDFCSAKDPTWEFPASDFVDENNRIAQSVGEWAACEECAALINTNQWSKLARRSLLTATGAMIAREAGEGAAVSYAVRLHKQFRKHQRGGGHRTVGVQ